ncbi:MAG: hypothetical protein CFH41_00528 [Alphaproteobacteria bacterium MarineAlpha11_Bin1]|nr:MAG: hypothetical protein CFH41_00528 [Alphaproteobacteria bacterium MarineAlpha11_Bin1]
MRNLTVTICLTIAVLIGSAGVSYSKNCVLQVQIYAQILADAARRNPKGVRQAVNRSPEFYRKLIERVNSWEPTTSRSILNCKRFVSVIRQHWDINISEIFTKLKRTPKPLNFKVGACARAMAIIGNLAQKQNTQKNRFLIWQWTANTQLVNEKECQWIVDGYG